MNVLMCPDRSHAIFFHSSGSGVEFNADGMDEITFNSGYYVSESGYFVCWAGEAFHEVEIGGVGR